MKAKEPAYYKLPITKWPKTERPREKLIKFGPFKLSDAELIAIILRTGIGPSSALDLSRELLSKANGLLHLSKMDYNEILALKVKGIGQTKAVTIAAAMQLSCRIESETGNSPDQIIHSSRQVAEIYGPKLRYLKKEMFLVILLATNNKILGDSVISEGILNASVVSPREVFRVALLHMAAGIILVHNHPSGNLEPSQEDIMLTKQVVASGKTMNIPVLDHIIIAGKDYTSFSDKGLI